MFIHNSIKQFQNKINVLSKKLFEQCTNLFFLIKTLNLRLMPRYVEGQTKIYKKRFRFIDAASFMFMYDEIFRKRIYQFNSSTKNPYIIDCGANIGLSIIFFNKLFPHAKILGFEPDPIAFNALQYNISQLNSNTIELIQKGVWIEQTVLDFSSNHSDGGRITLETQKDSFTISTVRLKDYLKEPIDLLKLDIEGAETKILEDCQYDLEKVKNLFVEYHSFIEEKQTLHTILSILNKAGFLYIIHHIGIFSPQPFTKINTSNQMNLQLNIYATRN